MEEKLIRTTCDQCGVTHEGTNKATPTGWIRVNGAYNIYCDACSQECFRKVISTKLEFYRAEAERDLLTRFGDGVINPSPH